MTQSRELPLGSANGDTEQELTDGVIGIADSVKEGIQQMTEIHRTSAMGMRQMMNATESLKQATFEGAVIASGQALPESAQIDAPRSQGSITINTPQPVDKQEEYSRSSIVQLVTGLVSAIIGGVWLSWLGTDAPVEVYAAVPLLVALLLQQGANAWNNYLKRSAK